MIDRLLRLLPNRVRFHQPDRAAELAKEIADIFNHPATRAFNNQANQAGHGPSGFTLNQLQQAASLMLGTPPPPIVQQGQIPGGFNPPGTTQSPAWNTLTNGQSIHHTPGTQSVRRTPVPEITARPSVAAEAVQVAIRARLSAYLSGGVGIGKSSIVAQVAEHLGMKLVDIRAVTLDPVDIRGLPSVENGITSWNVPEFFPREGCAPTLVFLDEINRAPALVQNACLQLMLDRRVGEYVLPDNCAVVAAGNRMSDGGGVNKMNYALASRMVRVNVVPDNDDWSKWGLANGIDPMVIAFLRFRPDLLENYQRDQEICPNPRAWSFVSRISAQKPSREVERVMVAGVVGEGAAVEYLGFVELYRGLPSIDAILLAPEAAPVPTQVQVLYAVSAALGQRATAENFDRVIAYLQRLPREYLVFAVRDAIVRTPALGETPEFVAFVVGNADVL